MSYDKPIALGEDTSVALVRHATGWVATIHTPKWLNGQGSNPAEALESLARVLKVHEALSQTPLKFTSAHVDIADEALGGAEVVFQGDYEELLRTVAQLIAEAESRGPR